MGEPRPLTPPPDSPRWSPVTEDPLLFVSSFDCFLSSLHVGLEWDKHSC